MSAGHTLVYLQRPTRESAKAGNLNNALQYSNGKVIMVMDAGDLHALMSLHFWHNPAVTTVTCHYRLSHILHQHVHYGIMHGALL